MLFGSPKPREAVYGGSKLRGSESWTKAQFGSSKKNASNQTLYSVQKRCIACASCKQTCRHVQQTFHTLSRLTITSFTRWFNLAGCVDASTKDNRASATTSLHCLQSQHSNANSWSHRRIAEIQRPSRNSEDRKTAAKQIYLSGRKGTLLTSCRCQLCSSCALCTCKAAAFSNKNPRLRITLNTFHRFPPPSPAYTFQVAGLGLDVP